MVLYEYFRWTVNNPSRGAHINNKFSTKCHSSKSQWVKDKP